MFSNYKLDLFLIQSFLDLTNSSYSACVSCSYLSNSIENEAFPRATFLMSVENVSKLANGTLQL